MASLDRQGARWWIREVRDDLTTTLRAYDDLLAGDSDAADDVDARLAMAADGIDTAIRLAARDIADLAGHPDPTVLLGGEG